MANKYQLLADLEALHRNGSISEEEYQRERARIMNSNMQGYENYPNKSAALGMDENTYLALMHLSQFAGFIIPGLGFAAPIIMWLVNKDKSANVDRHGKNILNFMISMIIYITISAILILLLIGIPMLVVLVILELIFIIIATVKAASGEYWKYPLSIPFFT